MPDSITESLERIEILIHRIEMISEDIKPIAYAMQTLGLSSGDTLHGYGVHLQECADSINRLRRDILNSLLNQARQASTNILQAALAGVQIATKPTVDDEKLRDEIHESLVRYQNALNEGPHDTTEEKMIFDDFIADLAEAFGRGGRR